MEKTEEEDDNKKKPHKKEEEEEEVVEEEKIMCIFLCRVCVLGGRGAEMMSLHYIGIGWMK